MSATNQGSTPAGDGSMSTVSTETVTGWHVLKVEGYSRLKGRLGVGGHVKSGAFSVGGHSWCITFFPDGYNKESAKCIGVGLCRTGNAYCDSIKVQATLNLLDQAGEPVSSYTRRCTFFLSEECKALIYDRFIERVELEDSPYLKDDGFQIRCDVTVFKEIRVETATVVESIRVPPPELHRHLGDLLAGEEGGDVTFEVGGETFAAHKYMLAARSSVFKAELFGPMKEKATHRVRIDDMEARVFKAMLHFIYTDTVPENDDDVAEDSNVIMSQHLLVAADRYDLQRLKIICEDTLAKCVNTDTAATTLVLAEQHDCRGLKEACFKFLRRRGNLRTVMAGDGFQHLKISCPSLLEELLDKVARQPWLGS